MIKLHYFPLDNPEKSVESKELEWFLKQGWQIQAHFFAEVQSKPSLVLVLVLPAKSPATVLNVIAIILTLILLIMYAEAYVSVMP